MISIEVNHVKQKKKKNKKREPQVYCDFLLRPGCKGLNFQING